MGADLGSPGPRAMAKSSSIRLATRIKSIALIATQRIGLHPCSKERQMKNPGKAISKLARYASVAMLFIAASLLVVWPLVQKLPLFSTPTQLFGLCVALLAALILDLARRIGPQEQGESVQVQRLSIGATIRAATDRRKSVTTLRVLASTTETILPALRDSSIHMKSCKVMVHDFSLSADPNAITQVAKSDSLIQTWSELPQRKIANEVVVKRVQFVPTFFVVIFDDRTLVHGLYIPASRSTNAVQYLEPMLIENRSLASQAIIDMFIKQFDDIFDETPIHVKSSRQK